METDENVHDDIPSMKNINVNKFPSLTGFFPIPLKKNEKEHYLHPIASSLTPNNKDNMESVRRSLIQSPSVQDLNNNFDTEMDKAPSLDNSEFVIIKDRNKKLNSTKTKKMTTFGIVDQMSIPSRKETQKEFDCTNEKFKEWLEKLLTNNYSMGFITILTIYCLFGDDIRTGFVDKNYDIVFNVISLVCIFIFTLEICISIVVRPTYYLSFFFWLDLISALSILLDLVWIQNLILM
jgi:hypothetical protein